MEKLFLMIKRGNWLIYKNRDFLGNKRSNYERTLYIRERKIEALKKKLFPYMVQHLKSMQNSLQMLWFGNIYFIQWTRIFSQRVIYALFHPYIFYHCRFYSLSWCANCFASVEPSLAWCGENILPQGELFVPWLQWGLAEDKTGLQVNCSWSPTRGVNSSIPFHHSARDIPSWWFRAAWLCISGVSRIEFMILRFCILIVHDGLC